MRSFTPTGRPEAERSFELFGQTFVVRERVKPQVIWSLQTLSDDDSTAEGSAQILATMDEAITQCLTRRSRDAWRALQDSDEDDEGERTVDLEILSEIAGFCLRVVSGQDPTSRTSSSESRDTSGGASTGDSSSPATLVVPEAWTPDSSATSPTPR